MLTNNQRTQRFLMNVLAAITLVTSANAGRSLAQTPIDVPQLIEMKAKWPAMAEKREKIMLEGRFQFRNGQKLRLQRCDDLAFWLADGLRMPRRTSPRDTIEIVGYLKQTSKEMQFVVQRISIGIGDLERVAALRRTLPQDKPGIWYAHADRVAKDARFYGDAELLKEAESLRSDGFAIERRALRPGDARALRKLAAKSVEVGLGENLQAEMIHRALRWEWDRERRKPKPDVSAFLKKLEAELVDCKKPIRGRDANLRVQYAKDPVKTYAGSRLDARPRCHRYFYREILLPTILAKLQKDNSNATVVAKELRDVIPEEGERAVELEMKHLEWRVSGITNTTRSDMLDIVDLLMRAGETDKAREAKIRWVKASEQRLVKRGPAGLVQSATEYDSLLKDRTNAVRLLKQAWNQSNEKKEIEQKLQSYDVFRQDGKWVAEANLRKEPEDEMQEALREGRIILGMTSDQVSKSVGKPDRVVRFVSARSVHTVWIYQSTRLNVLLERRKGSDSGAKVKSVYEVPQRR